MRWSNSPTETSITLNDQAETDAIPDLPLGSIAPHQRGGSLATVQLKTGNSTAGFATQQIRCQPNADFHLVAGAGIPSLCQGRPTGESLQKLLLAAVTSKNGCALFAIERLDVLDKPLLYLRRVDAVHCQHGKFISAQPPDDVAVSKSHPVSLGDDNDRFVPCGLSVLALANQIPHTWRLHVWFQLLALTHFAAERCC